MTTNLLRMGALAGTVAMSSGLASGCSGDESGTGSSVGTAGTGTPTGSGTADSGATTMGPGTADAGDESSGGSTGIPTCTTDVESQLAAIGVPGLSAGVVANGRLVCTAVAGMADIEEDRPVEVDTLFEWASVSKTVVVTAVMILVEEGHFQLDDDVSDHLPFEVRNPMCPDSPITFRHLMTHTSSIIDNDAIYDNTYTVGDSPVGLGDFLRDYLVPGGAHYDANENFDFECSGLYNEYSNIAAGGLLGYVVEYTAGQPFDDFCRERIFDRLGMTDTSFRLANLDVDTVARPYEASGGGFEPLDHPGYATYPDGLLRTSVPNLARFEAMMTQSGIYEGERILSQASIEEVKRVQFPNLDDTQGLIWYYDFGGALIGHDGEDDGASSLMFFDPTDGSGALLVGNAIWWDGNEEAPEANALFSALIEEAKSY